MSGKIIGRSRVKFKKEMNNLARTPNGKNAK